MMLRRSGNRVSRRDLFSTAAAATGLALVAPLLGRPALSLARTPTGITISLPQRTLAATPATAAPPPTLDEVIQAGVDRGLPGVALRVERAGEVVFDGAAGLDSIEARTPLTPADRFRIASVTKTFTATLVLQLVDEGLLTLDDTVEQWLDDPIVARIPHVDRITLSQLLNHTGGVYDYFDDDSPIWQDAYFGPDADWTRVWTPLELLAYADGTAHAPYFAPGEGFHYSNTGYLLLGLIVERAGGQEFSARLRSRILDPLGLAGTFFPATESMPGGMGDVYHQIDGKSVNVNATHLSALWTAGGMVSTTRDLARFAGALFGGELLQPATLDAMLGFVPTEWPGVGAGLGLMRMETPAGAIVGHEGEGPGGGARMFRLADADLTLVLLTNTGGADEIVAPLFAEVIAAALATDAPTG